MEVLMQKHLKMPEPTSWQGLSAVPGELNQANAELPRKSYIHQLIHLFLFL
jgi:hypothetical protein